MDANTFSTPEPCGYSRYAVRERAKHVAGILEYKPGDDLDPIVKRLGGKITYKDIWDLHAGDSGSIVIHGPKNFEIMLSQHTTIERDRFTISHELGHYILHYFLQLDKKPELKDRPMKTARHGSGGAEREANWFAAEFLMPEDAFKDAHSKCGGNILFLSETFGVSLSAASVRARSLGLPMP